MKYLIVLCLFSCSANAGSKEQYCNGKTDNYEDYQACMNTRSQSQFGRAFKAFQKGFDEGQQRALQNDQQSPSMHCTKSLINGDMDCQ